MEYFRIQTKYGSIPYRTVDMAAYAWYRGLPDNVYDWITESIDGTETTYAGKRRRRFQIILDGCPKADMETIRKLLGDRNEVCLESNYDRDTVLYNPFCRSVDPFIGPDATYARATVATYMDDHGMIREVASGEPRFEDCQMGKGILLENASTNRFHPSHASVGDVVWGVDAGAPVIAWDTNMPSNVDGHEGTVRITGTTNDVANVVIPGWADDEDVSGYIWVKGVGTMKLVFNDVDDAPKSTANIQLTMDWQRVGLDGMVKTAAPLTVEVELWLLEINTVCWISACQLESSDTMTSYIPAVAADTTRNMDSLSYAACDGFNYSQGSVAMWIEWPRLVTGCTDRILWLANASFYGYISADGSINMRISATPLNICAIPSSLPDAGDLVHIAFQWNEDFVGIILNGAVLAYTASQDRLVGSTNIIYLYNGANTANTVIDDFRIDTRFVEWRTSETGEYVKYADNAHIALAKLTQARCFTIKNEQFDPRPGQPGYFNGGFTLKESSSDENHTIEDA